MRVPLRQFLAIDVSANEIVLNQTQRTKNMSKEETTSWRDLQNKKRPPVGI
jgi:hypothetical protein